MADRGTNMPGTQCSRLLTPNHRAERDGSPDPQGQAPDATGSWHSHSAARFRSGPEPTDHVGAASVADSGSFSPRAVIATGSHAPSITSAEPAVRPRLLALPVIYLLILALATFWRCAVLGEASPILLFSFDAMVLIFLALGSGFGARAISRLR
jgi:eukaryotic-like serine/threonine-protein kinase